MVLYCLDIRSWSCISLLFLHILWTSVLIILRERRERFGYFVRRGSKREERETVKWCPVGTLYFPFTEYNIDKVLVDVATFLVSEPCKILVYCVWLCYVHA